MTHDEELALLKQCTDEVIKKYTDDKPINVVLLALFHESKRIHCTTNMLRGQQGVNWLLQHYLGNVPPAPYIESVWLHMSYRQVDGVSTSSALGCSSTKALAEEWLARQAEPSKQRCYGIEEMKVDCDD